MDGPSDPVSDRVTDAIQLHEAFLALVGAGFERNEALEILLKQMDFNDGKM